MQMSLKPIYALSGTISGLKNKIPDAKQIVEPCPQEAGTGSGRGRAPGSREELEGLLPACMWEEINCRRGEVRLDNGPGSRPTRHEVRQTPGAREEQLTHAWRSLLRRAAKLRVNQKAEFADQFKDFQDTVGQRLGN